MYCISGCISCLPGVSVVASGAAHLADMVPQDGADQAPIAWVPQRVAPAKKRDSSKVRHEMENNLRVLSSQVCMYIIYIKPRFLLIHNPNCDFHNPAAGGQSIIRKVRRCRVFKFPQADWLFLWLATSPNLAYIEKKTTE